jgi:hypothetical protein
MPIITASLVGMQLPEKYKENLNDVSSEGPSSVVTRVSYYFVWSKGGFPVLGRSSSQLAASACMSTSSNHNAKQLILIRCKHSQRAARSFVRGLEIRLNSRRSGAFTRNVEILLIFFMWLNHYQRENVKYILFIRFIKSNI